MEHTQFQKISRFSRKKFVLQAGTKVQHNSSLFYLAKNISISNTIQTQQQETGLFLFLQQYPNHHQSPSQLGHTNPHLKDELEDEDPHDQTTQGKEQETEENNFLVKSQNISKSLRQ